MSRWLNQITGMFPVDVTRLWIACDPDNVLLDENAIALLRERGFEVLPYQDPIVFRTEFEERYRIAWDQGKAGSASSLILHLLHFDTNELPWDYLRRGQIVRLSLAELFPKLAYNVVKQVEPANYASLYEAHETELQGLRGESESKDFILEHVYQIFSRSIRTTPDFWREIFRFHYTNRTMPALLAEHVALFLKTKEIIVNQPVALWLTNRSSFFRMVQSAWYRYLTAEGFTGSRAGESGAIYTAISHEEELEIPFSHPDVRTIVDSMFLDGTLHPLGIETKPDHFPEWIKTGIIEDPAGLQRLVSQGIQNLVSLLATPMASHRNWTEFGRHFGEVLSRYYSLETGQADMLKADLESLYKATDNQLHDWISARHYGDLSSLPVNKGPIMVHHIPRFLAKRRLAGESKIALLVFDGLAIDQWVQIREYLAGKYQGYQFEESACFAWLPTVTSVSRQSIFSGCKPREFEDSIDRTDKEATQWKAFWQNEGLKGNEIAYQKGLRRVDQLEALESLVSDPSLKVVGLVIDEVDERIHKECSKKDVAMWIGNWMKSGFVDQLFSILHENGYHLYLTADHGNVEAVGIGRPNQGVIAESRGERVRVYRSEELAASSSVAYPETIRFDIQGLPNQFYPLYAAGRQAFVVKDESVVVHGGVSVEELIVPFVKINKGNTN